jgi:hypothetical protein
MAMSKPGKTITPCRTASAIKRAAADHLLLNIASSKVLD